MRNSARIAAIARFAVTRAAATALFDGVGGTSLTAALAGVAAGTRIATESGDLAVEELRVDDILATGQRVASVSHRTLDVDALARDADARPVRIGAGAIADGIPARTLLVAPAQLLLIDNAVVPAAALVNGASVARLRPDAPVTYVRLRLDTPRGIIDARAALERGALDGDVATVDHRGAYGWALDTAHPSAPVTLEFVAGGAVLGEAPADVRRPDLEMAGLGEGRCGFLLRLRRPLPGNRPAFVTVRRAGDGAPMPRMPLLLPHPVGDPEEFAAALEHENAAAAEDEPVRETLANFLAHQVDRLLQARGERPSPPPAPDC